MATKFVPKQTGSRFQGRVAIVTGGASGIGLATVERLASEGGTVAIFDINEEGGREVEARLRASGLSVNFYSVDVRDKSKCLHAVEQLAAANDGLIHVLVNNAAYFGAKGLTACTDDWTNTMSVNVEGYSNMAQASHPYMKQCASHDRTCAIVNVASTAAHRPKPGRWTYSCSKGAILTLTKCMAVDLAPEHIRVNSVSPAWTYTPQIVKATGGDRDKWEPIWGPYHMLNRFCEPSEVAAAICFLCSEDASFITAIDLPVDGGYLGLSAEGFGKKSVFSDELKDG